MRLVSLKTKFSYPLTDLETELITVIEGKSFSIPAPLLKQLQLFGRTSSGYGEHLYPDFPPLPSSQIKERSGYFGEITTKTHNYHEELPCLGVLAEAISQAMSNKIGRYTSSLEQEDIIPNQNLLGYKPLLYRRNEAKELAMLHGITGSAAVTW